MTAMVGCVGDLQVIQSSSIQAGASIQRVVSFAISLVCDRLGAPKGIVFAATQIFHNRTTEETTCMTSAVAIPLFSEHINPPKTPPVDVRLSASHTAPAQETPRGDTGDLFLDFFWSILIVINQAQAAAYTILKRIQERTAMVEFLGNLIADIHAEPPGGLDWTNNPKMKDNLDKARALGIDIQKGYKFSEPERKALVQKIEAFKASFEKTSQLEMTDMQRHNQEITMTHEIRSGTLKSRRDMFDAPLKGIKGQ